MKAASVAACSKHRAASESKARRNAAEDSLLIA